MNKPERSRIAAFDQTWPAGVDLGHAPTLVNAASSVSTLRVRLVGDAVRPSEDGKTRPYPSALPSFEEPGVVENDTEWRDVSDLLDAPDRSYGALAYAHTLPDIPVVELGLEESGVHQVPRLSLWLHPRDSVSTADQRDGAPTLRVSAASVGPLARAWAAWEQQSPGMTIFMATVLCVVSALAVSLFAH
jgi:hypothetical protein